MTNTQRGGISVKRDVTVVLAVFAMVAGLAGPAAVRADEAPIAGSVKAVEVGELVKVVVER
jgi:hypothetical protein